MKARTLMTWCAGVLALAGCSAPRTGTGETLPEVNAGLASLAANRGADLGIDPTLDPKTPLPEFKAQGLAEQAALDLKSVMNRAERRASPVQEPSIQTPDANPGSPAAMAAPERPVQPAFAASATPAQTSPVARDAAATDLTAKAREAWSAAAAPAPAPQAVRRDPDDELVDLAQKMAAYLREPATRERPRIPDSAALAPIEALRPGAIESLETTGSLLSQRLSGADRRTLLEARDRLANNSEAAKPPAGLSKFASGASLRVAKATLCTKVMGFGKYNPYSSTTFTAGRPVPAIVYVEVENFTARPAREGDPMASGAALSEQVSVDLSQSLTLYQDPSGLQAWHRPPQSVVETGRNQRRDFYLIQQIELPRTLSIGRYNLKVTVKDRSSGKEAEAIIPISIVAQ